MEINVLKLHQELAAAGLPVVSVRIGSPIADFERELTDEEVKLAEQVYQAHDPSEPIQATIEDQIKKIEEQLKALMKTRR